MNTSSAHYVTPRDRVMTEILREMREMSLHDLVMLRDNAQALNKVRLEQQSALSARYPLQGDSHAE